MYGFTYGEFGAMIAGIDDDFLGLDADGREDRQGTKPCRCTLGKEM